MQFVIFHGSFGNPKENWFHWLKEELEKLGQDVLSPALPVDTWERVTKLGQNHPSDRQNLHNWTSAFEGNVLPKIKKDQPLCFIGHSLANVFILHMVNKYRLQLDSAIFVSPFLTHLGRAWQIDKVNESFYTTDFDFEKLRRLIPVSYAFYAENDPYVPKEKFEEFTYLTESDQIIIAQGGHFNSSAGFTTFPQLLDLCKTRISL